MDYLPLETASDYRLVTKPIHFEVPPFQALPLFYPSLFYRKSDLFIFSSFGSL